MRSCIIATPIAQTACTTTQTAAGCTSPKSWLKEKDGKLKCIDICWAKVVDTRSAGGERKYRLLLKVIKSFLSLKNSNASAERSISENNNNLRPERSSLTDEMKI